MTAQRETHAVDRILQIMPARPDTRAVFTQEAGQPPELWPPQAHPDLDDSIDAAEAARLSSGQEVWDG
jgi:hypothetical protein